MLSYSCQIHAAFLTFDPPEGEIDSHSNHRPHVMGSWSHAFCPSARGTRYDRPHWGSLFVQLRTPRTAPELRRGRGACKRWGGRSRFGREGERGGKEYGQRRRGRKNDIPGPRPCQEPKASSRRSRKGRDGNVGPAAPGTSSL